MRKGLTRLRLFLMVAVPALLQPLPALAADGTCFEGSRECRTFWITEAGLTPRLNEAPIDRYGMKFPGFTGHMALNLREWVQATAMVEVLTLDPDPLRYPEILPQTDTAWYAGITSGSYGGLIGSVVLGVAAAIAVASLQGF